MNCHFFDKLIGFLLTSLFISVFIIPADAVEVKISQLNGGKQYWWEAEDFDKRDNTIMLLKEEAGNPLPDLPGAFGDEYIVHKSADKLTAVEGSASLEYKISVTNGGKYYVWARASWARVAGSRDHNSMYIQVNGEPALGAFAKHVNTLADANWPNDFDQNNPWVWVGDSAQPVALQGVAGGGLTNGLVMNFKSGENTFIIYHREGDVDNSTICTDAVMISTVDFAPKDEDYNKASLAVEPMSKLAAKWAQLKARMEFRATR